MQSAHDSIRFEPKHFIREPKQPDLNSIWQPCLLALELAAFFCQVWLCRSSAPRPTSRARRASSSSARAAPRSRSPPRPSTWPRRPRATRRRPRRSGTSPARPTRPSATPTGSWSRAPATSSRPTSSSSCRSSSCLFTEERKKKKNIGRTNRWLCSSDAPWSQVHSQHSSIKNEKAKWTVPVMSKKRRIIIRRKEENWLLSADGCFLQNSFLTLDYGCEDGRFLSSAHFVTVLKFWRSQVPSMSLILDLMYFGLFPLGLAIIRMLATEKWRKLKL